MRPNKPITLAVNNDEETLTKNEFDKMSRSWYCKRCGNKPDIVFKSEKGFFSVTLDCKCER